MSSHTVSTVAVSTAIQVAFRAIGVDAELPVADFVVHVGSQRTAGRFCRLHVDADGQRLTHWASHASREDMVRLTRQFEAGGMHVIDVAPLGGHDDMIADIPAVVRRLADAGLWDVVHLPDNADTLCDRCDREHSFVARAAVTASTMAGRVSLCRRCARVHAGYAGSGRRMYPGVN